MMLDSPSGPLVATVLALRRVFSLEWLPWRRDVEPPDLDDWYRPVRHPAETLAGGYRADDEAEQRADQMLREQLGDQYLRLKLCGYLDVRSRLFKNTVYRLRLRRPIEVFKNGRRQPWRLCIVSIERVPAADELLMKLLWLRTNEEYVLATANRVR